MTVTLSVTPDVSPLIAANIALGLNALPFDLGTVHLSIDRNIPEAISYIVPDGLVIHINDLGFEADPANQIAPKRLGMHEGMHERLSFDNPDFVALTYSHDGSAGRGWYFHGRFAMAENDGLPVPVNEVGHILLPGLVMSDESHPADAPQTLSGLELAMLHDMEPVAAEPSKLAELYAATFNRSPDAPGLAYWAVQHNFGMSLADIAKSFFVQSEATLAYPEGTTPAQFVETIYHNALGRAPDAGGLAYWVGEIASGHVDRATAVLAVIDGAQGADLVHLVGIASQIA